MKTLIQQKEEEKERKRQFENFCKAIQNYGITAKEAAEALFNASKY